MSSCGATMIGRGEETEEGLAILKPTDQQPLCMALTGKLAAVLTGAGYLKQEADLGAACRIQLLRYFCGSDAYARLVRIRISVPEQQDWIITPRSAEDEIYLERWIPMGKRVTAQLERAIDASAASLPDPFPDVDVRLEVMG